MSARGKAPRMADLARAAGVSTMTVSRAFKDDQSVNADTRAKIMRLAREMGYVFDRTASDLRSQKSGFVAMTVPSINNPNFADTVRGLTEGLADYDLQVLLGYTNYDVDQEERLLTQLLRRRPQGIVVTGGNHTEVTRHILASSAVPVVETWDKPKGALAHTVGFSNADAGALMVDHFVARGLTRIAFIGGDTRMDTRGLDRRRGVVRRLQALGLDDQRMMAVGPPPVMAARGAAAIKALLDQWPDTQAVMCVADFAAFGAMTECQRMGLNVPADIAIAGFGAFDLSAFAVPPITTIDPKGYDIGYEAAQLIGRAQSSQISTPQHISVELELMARASTGS